MNEQPTSKERFLRDALETIKKGPPPTMGNEEVAGWAIWIAAQALARRPADEPSAPSSGCPYCRRPVDSQGAIFHATGCVGLDDIKLSRLFLHRLDAWLAAYMHDRHNHDEAAWLLARVRELIEPETKPGALAEQIAASQRRIEKWPSDVKAAMGIADETRAARAGHYYSPRLGTEVCFICGFHKREHAPEHFLCPRCSGSQIDPEPVMRDFGNGPEAQPQPCVACSTVSERANTNE